MLSGILKCYQELIKDFHRLHHDLLTDCGPETVHDLRVNLKRQSAFYALLEIIDKTLPTQETFGLFRELHKKTGTARDLQVEREIVAKDEKHLFLPDEFSAWLRERESRALDKAQEVGTLSHIRQLEEEITHRLQHLPPALLAKKIPRYFNRLLVSLKKQLRKKKSLDLHHLRRQLKELMFNLEMLNSLTDQSAVPEQQIKELNRWQRLLGRWHDYEFVLTRIKKDKQPCPKALRGQYRIRLAALEKQVISRRKELVQLLEQIEQDLRTSWPKLPQPLPYPHARKAHPSIIQKNINEGYL